MKLDELLKPTNQKVDVAEGPLLAQYLKHCCWLRTYFVSINKCGKSECTVCLPPVKSHVAVIAEQRESWLIIAIIFRSAP